MNAAEELEKQKKNVPVPSDPNGGEYGGFAGGKPPTEEEVKRATAPTPPPANKPALTPEEERAVIAKHLAEQGQVADGEGVVHLDNGKLAGQRPTPNAGAGIPEGGFAAQKQAEMDAATEAFLNKAIPGRKSQKDAQGNYILSSQDMLTLTKFAQKQNAAYEARTNQPAPKRGDGTPSAKTGGSFTVVGGGKAARDARRKAFIEKNPNAVSPAERARVLGTGRPAAAAQPPESFDQALKQQQSDAVQQRVTAMQQQADAEKAEVSRSEVMKAQRRAAMGEAFKIALDGLGGPIEEGDSRIRSRNGKHYLMYSVSPGGLKAFNDRMRQNGGKSDYANVMAYVEVMPNGKTWKAVGQPMLAYRSWKDGQKEQTFRKMSVSHYEPMLFKAYRTLGYDDDGARTMTGIATSGYGGITKSTTGKGAGSGLEIAKLNAEQKEKDRAERVNNRKEQMAFKEKSLKLMAAKGLYKEAKDLFSNMSDEDKEYFTNAYPDIAKQIIGDAEAPAPAATPAPAAQTKDGAAYSPEQMDAFGKLGYTPEQIAEITKRGGVWNAEKKGFEIPKK